MLGSFDEKGINDDGVRLLLAPFTLESAYGSVAPQQQAIAHHRSRLAAALEKLRVLWASAGRIGGHPTGNMG
jgi:hypothetical protein